MQLYLLTTFSGHLRKGEKAPNDPWDARTLEWTIPSPPPEYNFGIEPEVKQLDDFWHQKYDHDGNKQRYLSSLATTQMIFTCLTHLSGHSFWHSVSL